MHYILNIGILQIDKTLTVESDLERNQRSECMLRE